MTANQVRDNSSRHRFELEIDGHTAVAHYSLDSGLITFMHTEVPAELGGRGIGSQLARGALEQARSRGLKVVARCEFMAGYIAKHPEYGDLTR